MKKLMWVVLIIYSVVPVLGQASTERISRELQFEKKGPGNTIMIFNINGSIKVEGYAGDKILIEVEKQVGKLG